MRCTVRYSELYRQLFGIIVIPLLLAAIYVVVMYLLRWLDASEIVMNIYILAGSVVVVLAGIFIVRKLVLIEADVEYDLNGVHFQLKNSSFLYKNTSISLLYNNIESLSFGDNDNYRVYVKIKTTLPKKMVFVSPDKYENNASFIAYWNDVAERIRIRTKK